MPKNISRKDTKIIYCAYKIGEVNKVSQYSEIHALPCQITVFSGRRTIEYEGKAIQYNATALFNVSYSTSYINSSTKFWLKCAPTDTTKTDAEYCVVGKSAAFDGLFTVYLAENTPNYNKLYVEKEGVIYSISVDFDNTTLKGIIPNDMYFPFNAYNKFWSRTPKSIDDTSNRLYLLSVIKGKTSTELQFSDKE